MDSSLPEHAAQALVQTGNMADEKEMAATLARVVRDHIFPLLKFALDPDFVADGKIYKVCRKYITRGGGNRDHFKYYWQMSGWKLARKTINSKRNGVQDSLRKHSIKCKQVAVIACFLLLDNITLTYSLLVLAS